MFLTFDKLFNEPTILNAVIENVQARNLDQIFWKKHLDFEETKTRVFKTYVGTVTGVTAGSIIDRNSNKPLRERKSLGEGWGEVAYLGDRYQMDNDRLDMLQELMNKFNNAGSNQGQALNDIINYIVDDMRQVLLAPHKRMDLVVGDLRSNGKASVKVDDNPNGVELIDIDLPVHRITPEVADKDHFVKYLMEKTVALRTSFGKFLTMEMNRSTFIKNIAGSADFGDFFKQTFNQKEVTVATGLMSSEMASTVLQGLGLPAVVINEDMVELADGSFKNVFQDNRISLFTTPKQGKMRWHTPYEVTDPVPNKVYSRGEGGMYISNVRTDEGRFMEYGAEWIPEFTTPNKIVILDLDTMNA